MMKTGGGSKRPEEFESKIVAFCCHFCGFAAADLAGTMRLRYPPNVHIIRLPCTGKVDALYLLKAFENGADGVLVIGCEEGSCHFISGNLRAKRRVEHVKGILEEIGIESARLEFFNLSSSMGDRFAEIAGEMSRRVGEMGPIFRKEVDERSKVA
ncbi:MAG: hydrogenase iron-sulfur subunit [Candidatus Bipolaricaulia bacterium]